MNPLSPVDYQQMILRNKEELAALLKQITDIHYENFRKTSIYAKIVNVDLQKQEKKLTVFTYAEQEILEKEIMQHFDLFTRNLHTACSVLTLKELLICCLSLWFSSQTVSRCLGYSNTDNFRRQKSRIKKKMTVDTDAGFLFDFIFLR
jgi:hypothetical protein